MGAPYSEGLIARMAVADRIAAFFRRLVQRGRQFRRTKRVNQMFPKPLTTARPRLTARRPIDLNGVIAPALQKAAHVRGDSIRMRLRLSATPLPAAAEAADIEHIVLNLALNAQDVMTGVGVLTVEAVEFGTYARLTISDTRHGVSPEVQERVFEPFFTTRVRGSGLALSSIASTVQKLGGKMIVESHAGRGTTMAVILPLVSPRRG